jgi:hypothetical protein
LTEIRALIWLGPVAFLVHDLEEVLTMERWTREHISSLPSVVQPFLPVTTAQVAVAVALLLTLFVCAAYAASRTGRRGGALTFFVFLVVTLGLNGLGHIVQAVVFQGYVPGLVTAVLVSLPYAAFLIWRMHRRGLFTARKLAILAAAGAVAHVPAVALVLSVGKMLAS